MQNTYATATFQFVGNVIAPNFDRNARDSMEKAKAKGANFVMLFLEKANTPAYSTFKDLADRTYGMQSICVVWNEKRGFTLHYQGNIAMKINLKAGGINHTVDGVE